MDASPAPSVPVPKMRDARSRGVLVCSAQMGERMLTVDGVQGLDEKTVGFEVNQHFERCHPTGALDNRH